MSWPRRRVVMGIGAALGGCALKDDPPMAGTPKPLIIAHRGASGRLPEHTLEGYRLAASLGADVIEPDLVFTKDGHLICRHDRYLSGSTNVSEKPEFAGRKRQEPGQKQADWYAEDFTLEEIKNLKARQPFKGRDTRFDDQYEIPTFAELLMEAKAKRWRLCPEAKQPDIAAALGHDFKVALQPFFAAAQAREIGPSFIQCFDPAWLQTIEKMPNMERVQLIYHTSGDYDLAGIQGHCEALGPNKGALVTPSLAASALCRDAQALGLKLYPWTFRSDQLPDGVNSPADEYALFFGLGVDGVFSDHTADALAARESWLRRL
ncbi:MAG: glycerophosphodiester phosphodiesterase family protein [Pseudomonadota bacterium]